MLNILTAGMIMEKLLIAHFSSCTPLHGLIGRFIHTYMHTHNLFTFQAFIADVFIGPIGLDAAEPRSTTALSFPFQCLCGILLTQYSIRDGRFEGQRPMLFYRPMLLALFLSSTGFHFSSFYRLVLWGWGLWNDRVQIALSPSCIANLFH